MLRLRRRVIDLFEEDSNLYASLELDTLKTDFRSRWDRFFKNERRIDKPWAGSVQAMQKTFRIRQSHIRNGMLINGREVNDGSQKRLELTYGCSWYVVLYEAVLWLTLLSVMMVFNFHIGVSIISASVWILHIVLIIGTLNSAEKQFNNYMRAFQRRESTA